MTVEDNKNNDAAEIKRAIEKYVEALRARDIDGVMSIYAPELVAFDLVPPLQYVGADVYRNHWLEGWSLLQGPMGYEVHDLSITVGDDVAFTRSLNRSSATLKTGQKTEFWLRWTTCWRKINGKWLIMHMHVSVPFDVATGRAMFDLKP
jgi:ketosteroid isomerase-like protein